MLSDLKFAVRQLIKTPGFTFIAIATLALGIGANTAMFSVVDTLLLRAAPFPHPEEIVQVLGTSRQSEFESFSEPDLPEIRAQATSFSSLAPYSYWATSLAEPGQPAEQITGVLASAEMFPALGMQPMLGRAFTAEEEQPGRNNVIVIGHAFWQSRFGGAKDVIGRTLRINSEQVTVIGVMPPRFDYKMLWGPVVFWRPLTFTKDQVGNREYRVFQFLGRLKPGFKPSQALAELTPLAARQLKDFPQVYAGRSYRVALLHEALMDNIGRKMCWMLLGLSGFVLLIACANLANLQLARATARMRDLAIRSAMGASRRDLIFHQLVECLLLSITGGALGLMVASWITTLLERNIQIGPDQRLELPINGQALLFTGIVAVLTGVIFGIVPAWLASRTDVNQALKQQSRGSTTGRGHHRVRNLLIVAQVGLALVLLAGAGVMIRGFSKMLKRDVGWNASHLLTATVTIPEKFYETAEKRTIFHRKLEDRLKLIPNVESVSISTGLPIGDYGNAKPFQLEGQAAAATAAEDTVASQVMVTVDFFKTLQIPLIEGRTFSPDVRADSPQVMVINEALAKKIAPNGSALGKRLGFTSGRDKETSWREVIGVVRDVRFPVALTEPATRYQIYRPMIQEPWSWFQIALRGPTAETLDKDLRHALADLDPDIPATFVYTIPQWIDLFLHNFMVINQTLVAFAALGLMLSAIGLYGIIAGLVAQRTGEFGIRLALGARPQDVLGLVLNQGLRLAVSGIALGLIGAYLLNRFLGSVMSGIGETDPLMLGLVALLLFAVAMLACYVPARRATKVNPLVALRAE